MKIAVYSTKPYDIETLAAANKSGHTFTFLTPRLEKATVPLAAEHDGVCVFVNDDLSAKVLEDLQNLKVRFVAMRCAGFNNVDLEAARKLAIVVARVPEYSPFAVAEHTIGMMLSLNRNLHRAYNRVLERNFSLQGLLGFDLNGRTVGVVGTGKIGRQVCRILNGFGCRIIAYDRTPDSSMAAEGVQYCELNDLLSEADIITLHCPLTPDTHHLVNARSIAKMKKGVMLINTSRGGLLNTSHVLKGLKSGQIGYLGLDVYEDEADLFFEERSAVILQDDLFARLLTFNNVLITGHQAFFTRDALEKIAAVTLENITMFGNTGDVPAQCRVV